MGFFKSFFSGKQEKPKLRNRKTIKRTSRYSSMTACVHNAWGVPDYAIKCFTEALALQERLLKP